MLILYFKIVFIKKYPATCRFYKHRIRSKRLAHNSNLILCREGRYIFSPLIASVSDTVHSHPQGTLLQAVETHAQELPNTGRISVDTGRGSKLALEPCTKYLYDVKSCIFSATTSRFTALRKARPR